MGDEARRSDASRQAAELILQDERLAADLEDREADALLRWALAVAEQIVSARLQRGEAVDRDAVAEAVHPLRQVARGINDLVARHAGLDQHEFLASLLALIDSACRLAPGVAAPGKPAAELSVPLS